MLQQTQVDRVIPKYAAFLARFPTLSGLARARFAEVARAWVGLGYNGRALRLWRCARAIVRDHRGIIPSDPETLRTLPGIGEYTAAAVASFAFRKSVPVVDTNVRRVLVRALTGRDRAAPAQVDRLARIMLPRTANAQWAQGLMDIGARFCRPVARCEGCPLRQGCAYRKRGSRRAPTATSTPIPFAGSDRFYRGRIVRLLCTTVSVALDDLGQQVKERFDASDAEWLERIIERLARDGLVAIDRKRGRIRLP